MTVVFTEDAGQDAQNPKAPGSIRKTVNYSRNKTINEFPSDEFAKEKRKYVLRGESRIYIDSDDESEQNKKSKPFGMLERQKSMARRINQFKTNKSPEDALRRLNSNPKKPAEDALKRLNSNPKNAVEIYDKHATYNVESKIAAIWKGQKSSSVQKKKKKNKTSKNAKN